MNKNKAKIGLKNSRIDNNTIQSYIVNGIAGGATGLVAGLALDKNLQFGLSYYDWNIGYLVCIFGLVGVGYQFLTKFIEGYNDHEKVLKYLRNQKDKKERLYITLQSKEVKLPQEHHRINDDGTVDSEKTQEIIDDFLDRWLDNYYPSSEELKKYLIYTDVKIVQAKETKEMIQIQKEINQINSEISEIENSIKINKK